MESKTATLSNPADEGADATLSVTATGDLNPPLAQLRERLSWALYDFANTVFSMNIASLYFAAWLVKDLGHSNTLYATVNGIASTLVVVSIPVFGAAAVVGPFVWALAVDGLTPLMGTGFAYRAGVVSVAIGMALALWMLRGVPDNFNRSVSSK